MTELTRWKDFVTFQDSNKFRPNWYENSFQELKTQITKFSNTKIFPSNMNKNEKTCFYNIFDKYNNPIEEVIYQRGHNKNVFTYMMPLNTIDNVSNRKIKNVIYLGWLNPHYGHFITETMSRFWIKRDLNSDIWENSYFYFDIHTSIETIESKTFIKLFLKSFGIEEEKIIFGDKSYEVENFYVPSPSIVLHKSINIKDLNYIWSHFSDYVNRKYPNKIPLSNSKIFLSRSKLKKDKRPMQNEIEVEDRLKKNGYVIIYPETLSFIEQFHIYNQAKIIIGASGSALHNVFFMKENTKIISLTTQNFVLLNELLCCIPNNINYYSFITNNVTNTWEINLNELIEFIKTIDFQ